MRVDPASLLVEGPWEHQFVSANGCRFHVATAGEDDAPLVVLLHGFPQTWYAWRAQIPALAEAGWRVAAMDLRGFGSSDKPPRGHDTRSLAADVSGVIRSLGATSAVVVGHGYGGQVAWAMPALAPAVTRAIVTVSAPHPRVLRRPGVVPWQTLRSIVFAQLPSLPERKLRGDWVRQVLTAWGAPRWQPDPRAVELYASAMRQPAAAHHVMEQARWQVRSTRRPSGRSVLSALNEPIAVPVLTVHGGVDRCLPSRSRDGDADFIAGRFTNAVVETAGHWIPEESPEGFTAVLLGFLDVLAPEA
ncbi:alpha/beta fold hydrolase [Salana multivorans]